MINAVAAGGALDVEIAGGFVENFSFNDDAGEPDDFWAYHLAEPADIDPGVDWTFASVGPGDRMLQDGSLDGWYNGFDGSTPTVPTITVPAPASAGLLALVAIVAPRRRRR